MSSAASQQHPLGIYFRIWILLFVISTCSYLVDFFNVQGNMRWVLVITFMLLKAGFIVAVFMHVMWERMALVFTILGPPLLLLLLIGFMAIEGNYTTATRYAYMGHDPDAVALTPSDIHSEANEGDAEH